VPVAGAHFHLLLPAEEVDGETEAAAAVEAAVVGADGMSGKKVLNNSSIILGEVCCWRVVCVGCPAAGDTCSCTLSESSRLWMTEWRRRSRRTRPPARGSSLDDEEADEEFSASLAGPLLAPGPRFPPPTIRRQTGSGTPRGHGTVLRPAELRDGARTHDACILLQDAPVCQN
jgi:hypothetical protein